MADTIIKFPGAGKTTQSAASVQDFIAKFDEVVKQTPPEACREVQNHETMEVITVPQGLKSLPDIATGGKRNPRWGVTLSFSVMPELNKAPTGPIMIPQTQSQFFASDSLEQIKDRVIFEIEKAIKLANLAVGNPEGYQAYEMAAMEQRLSSLRELEEDGS
jgi:hypothetical protein